MARKARMLITLAVALSASLTCALPAMALDVKVRVELNQADVFHGFVDRTPVTVTAGGPDLVDPSASPANVGCKSDSPMAALANVLGPTNLSFTNEATTASVTKLKGLPTPLPPSFVPAHWEVYVGGKHELNPCRSLAYPDEGGTEVLAYLKCGATTPASVPCFKGTPLILRSLNDAPWPIAPLLTNVSAPVYVYRADESGGRAPSATAVLRTDESPNTIPTDQTYKDGSARVNFFSRGPHTIVATDSTGGAVHVPDRIPVCITETSDGYCGQSQTAPNPFDANLFPADCQTNGHDGLCGTQDTSGPLAHVLNITNKQIFKKKKGPGKVTGHLDVDPNGVKGVRLRLTRVSTARVRIKAKKRSTKKANKSAVTLKRKSKPRYRTVKRCTAWDGGTTLLEPAKCGATYGKWFDAELSDLRYDFSYAFAMTLPSGTYLLEVDASDENGFKDAPAPGRNVITFRVL